MALEAGRSCAQALVLFDVIISALRSRYRVAPLERSLDLG